MRYRVGRGAVDPPGFNGINHILTRGRFHAPVFRKMRYLCTIRRCFSPEFTIDIEQWDDFVLPPSKRDAIF
jgi:hypothetical protein